MLWLLAYSFSKTPGEAEGRDTLSDALSFPVPITSLLAEASAGLKDHDFYLLVKAVFPDHDR